MDRLIVTGGTRLCGRLPAAGSKNEVLPLMAAAMLASEPLVIRNVPDLRDVRTMLSILQRLGVEVDLAGDVLTLQASDHGPVEAPYDLVSTMRASVCVLGPLVARRGAARVSMPGGCVFGVRPVDLHVKGLNALGAGIEVEGGYLVAGPDRHLRGADVYLGSRFGSSVLATAQVLSAAVLAEGTTRIENAAMEPEITRLAQCLQQMGARIEGVGGHRLVVHGVEQLGGADVTVGADRIEAGTFLVGAAMTGGDVTVENVRPHELMALSEVLRSMGAEIVEGDDSIRCRADGRLESADVTTLPYPGFPTDLQAQLMAAMCTARGISLVTERIFPDRFMHVAELLRLGARIRKEGSQAIVHGTERLSGATVMASDLRASAALVLAGLVADGETEIRRVYHIDRGYSRIDERLGLLGATIRRETQPKLDPQPADW
ncbi:MAG: UDP-N-acetylglucosamine 1-carboxyvinyltransferase [Planctomycetes bacterium]|nr:UDP-N-acetylglucosamine 1-carboxyvinyltransferase [Planctomycetota bacterium]